MAATKVKGLLKGIKSISNIFEEKEPEMQIGLPTDVKHVAHIGSDGPSTNKPSWMNDFKSTEQSSGPLSSNAPSEGHPVSKQRQQSSTDSPATSPTKKNSGGTKHRHRNTDPGSQGEETNVRRTRRHHRSTNSGAESGSSDVPAAPKQTRRRKHKGSSGGVSELSTISHDNQDPLSDVSFTDHGSACSERVSVSKYR